MKVLLTGAGGQLGQALIASAPKEIELVATGRQQLDLADPDACRPDAASTDVWSARWSVRPLAHRASASNDISFDEQAVAKLT